MYYPFEYKENLNVGSGVRPANIKTAFSERYDAKEVQLIFIHGNQKSRLNQLNELKSNINSADILYCYIEFPNIPLIFSNSNHIPTRPDVDFKWFKYFKSNDIPLGGFVRDIYWKFEELYPAERFKVKLNYLFSDMYLCVFKRYLDIMFLPSIEMNKYIGMDAKKIYALPSGGNIQRVNSKKSINVADEKFLNAVYVGALHKTTGYELMLKSIESYNKQTKEKIKLTMIIRENSYLEAKGYIDSFLEQGWLEIKHLSVSENPEDLINADFALLPYETSEYHDFSMPVKLIEYISFGLPILMMKNKAMNNFINEINAGVIVEGEINSFIEGLDMMAEKIKSKEFSKGKIAQQFLDKHTWKHRVLEIESVMLKKGRET